MFEDIKSQFHNQILAKYLKFRKLRKNGIIGNDELALAATDCAAALFHFREHIPPPHRQSREAVSSHCADYKLIADVTNAIKHGEIARKPKDGPSLLNSAANIYELAVIINFDGRGQRYSHSEPVVCVDCSDGIRRCLDDAVVNVINYWGSELARLGIGDFWPIQPIPFPGTVMTAPEDARSLQVRATKGLKFQTRFQLMKFDCDAGFAKPVDLNGASVNFKMHRLRYTLEIYISKPEINNEYVHEMELSDDQLQEWLSLTTDAEKIAFQTRLFFENIKDIEEGLAGFIKLNLRDSD